MPFSAVEIVDSLFMEILKSVNSELKDVTIAEHVLTVIARPSCPFS